MKPIVAAIYNPGPAVTTTILIKIPKVLIDVIDINNNLLVADIICANSTEANNCDLYFSS